MKILLKSAFSIAIAISPMLAIAESPPTGAALINIGNAMLDREQMARDLAYQLAPIKSENDLRVYLARNTGESPLRLLSEGAKQRFLQSLVFTDKGLGSFDYSDLRVELTASQIYQILSLFGAQNSTKSIPDLRVVDTADAIIASQGDDSRMYPADDYPGYRCVRPATCVIQFGSICIGGNCGNYHVP